MKTYKDSELILNPNGSVYHLQLRPEQIADTVVFVGDPGRVKLVSQYFDRIEHQVEHREFLTHTGYIGDKRISCISTGIGTDNIDIVLNELDAIVNIDLDRRTDKAEKRSLNIVRIGTTGSLQEDIPVDSWIVSSYGLGLDGLMNYYRYERNAEQSELIGEFLSQTGYPSEFSLPYIFKGSDKIIPVFTDKCIEGITLTAPGFYAPQGRVLRYELREPELMDRFSKFLYKNRRITNFEMETAGIYGLGTLLGHHICSLNAVVANRSKMEFSANPQESVNALIRYALDKIMLL